MNHDYAIETHAAERYLLHELTEEECDAYEEHFFSCSICADEVKSASDFLDSARQVVQDELKKHIYKDATHYSIWGRWFDWRTMGRPMPAMACALLVVVSTFSAYQNRVTIPELRQMGSAQLITSDQAEITLTQAHAGGADVATVSKGQPLLVRFAIPPDALSAGNLSSYRADVETESGIKKFSFVLSGQQTNSSIAILFRPGALAPGRYAVVIREVNSPESESGVKGEPERLPFEVVLH